MADALSNLDLKSIIKMVVIFGMSELGGLLLLWLGISVLAVVWSSLVIMALNPFVTTGNEPYGPAC